MLTRIGEIHHITPITPVLCLATNHLRITTDIKTNHTQGD
jgi:hypothetical protein